MTATKRKEYHKLTLSSWHIPLPTFITLLEEYFYSYSVYLVYLVPREILDGMIKCTNVDKNILRVLRIIIIIE